MFASPASGLLVLLIEHLLATPLVAYGDTTCAREAGVTHCWGAVEFPYGAGVTDVPNIRKWALRGPLRCVLADDVGLRCDKSFDSTVRRLDDPNAPPVRDFALYSRGGCMLRTDGLVDCWGDTRGVTTTSPLVIPDGRQIVVIGELSDASACILTHAGDVICWTVESDIAPRVALRDAVTLAGYDHNLCATRRDGSVACWRAPHNGESEVETRVADIEDATSVAVGKKFACARRSRGGVTCWSMDEKSRPGRPRSIPGITQATSVAVGDDHACARDIHGQIWCWGSNYYGQLGQHDIIDELTEPTVIPEIDDAVALAGNITSTCALLAGGQIACWGRDYDSSENEWHGTPSVRADLPPALRLFPFGKETMCAQLRGGEIRCWGRWRGEEIRRPKAAITEILGHDYSGHVCIRSRDRSATCTFAIDWFDPRPRFVQLRQADLLTLDTLEGVFYGVARPGYWQIRSDVRGRVLDLSSVSSLVTKLSESLYEMCALDILGAVACFDVYRTVAGWMESDSVDLASLRRRSMGMANDRAGSMDLVDVVDLSAGFAHICALDTHGLVYCWGENGASQLGQETEEPRTATPLRVPGVENVVQILAIRDWTCALLKGGAVACWGSSRTGTTGVGNGAYSHTPVTVLPAPHRTPSAW